MTEKEKQKIINIVHRTVLGFFDRSLDEERYLTETEKTLLEVNKAICNGVKEMPTVEQRPHGEWIDVNGDGSLWKCSNCNEKSCCRGNFCSDCGSDNRPKEGE